MESPDSENLPSPKTETKSDVVIPAVEFQPPPPVEFEGMSIVNQGVQVGDSNIHFNYYPPDLKDDAALEARRIFLRSIHSRDEFMSTFLNQALRQASTTFNLSVYFMVVGGLIFLAAAMLAITRFAGSPSHGVALVSGIGGLLIGGSGAAFSRKADKSRKHLAQQASMMQSQLLGEQKFSQIIDLLTGIRDPKLNDQARISLAMRLMGEIDEYKEVQSNQASLDRKRHGNLSDGG